MIDRERPVRRETDASPEARAIVALDAGSWAEARALVERLGSDADFYKVGSELFTSAGRGAVEWLRREGKEVFLDLKFHDIPATVLGAARSAAALGASLLTVHASGGTEMVRAAVEGAGETTGVMAVTVLTSLDVMALSAAVGRPIGSMEDEVERLAHVAWEARAHGVVCAGSDAARLRARFGDRLALLVPGIRLAGTPVHDQARVVTPAVAVGAGARYLVLGRTVTAASDPSAALAQALREMREARESASKRGAL